MCSRDVAQSALINLLGRYSTKVHRLAQRVQGPSLSYCLDMLTRRETVCVEGTASTVSRACKPTERFDAVCAWKIKKQVRMQVFFSARISNVGHDHVRPVAEGEMLSVAHSQNKATVLTDAFIPRWIGLGIQLQLCFDIFCRKRYADLYTSRNPTCKIKQNPVKGMFGEFTLGRPLEYTEPHFNELRQ